MQFPFFNPSRIALLAGSWLVLLGTFSDTSAQEVRPVADDAMFAAIQAVSKEQFEAALKAGANPNARRRDGSYSGLTPLIFAILTFNPEIKVRERVDLVELLLRRGADPSLEVNGGLTPLLFARRGNYTVLKELLQRHGAKEKVTTTTAGNALSTKVDAYYLIDSCEIYARMKDGQYTGYPIVVSFDELRPYVERFDWEVVRKQGRDAFGNNLIFHIFSPFDVGISRATYELSGQDDSFWSPFAVDPDPTITLPHYRKR